MDSTEPPKKSDIAARFELIESAIRSRRVESEAKFSVEELPVILKIGAEVLAIVHQQADLLPPERESNITGRKLSSDIETLIIDPRQYDIHEGRGYKALRRGQTVKIGRSDADELPRFAPLSKGVSRHHAEISKSKDGKTITIKDLGSTNGTYAGAVIPMGDGDGEKTLEQEPRAGLEAYGAWVASAARPERNEDSLLIEGSRGWFGVFDGVGSHEAGDMASAIARDIIAAADDEPVAGSLSDWSDYLDSLLQEANKAIRAADPHAASTAVIAKVHEVEGQRYLSIAHIGDSRAYIAREGTVQMLTIDHTPYTQRGTTQEARELQARLSDTKSIAALTDGDAEAFNGRNYISAALGFTDEVRGEVQHIPVSSGDVVILTTDGIHDNLTTQEIEEIVTRWPISDSAQALVRAAREISLSNQIRSKKDDMTAVVVRL